MEASDTVPSTGFPEMFQPGPKQQRYTHAHTHTNALADNLLEVLTN